MGLIGLKSRCQQSCISFWRLYRRIHFLAFSNVQKQPTFLGGPLPSSKPTNESFSCFISLTLTLQPLSSIYKDPEITLDPPRHSRILSLFQSQLISNLNFICNLNSLLPHNVTQSQVLGVGRWISLAGAFFFLPQQALLLVATGVLQSQALTQAPCCSLCLTISLL